MTNNPDIPEKDQSSFQQCGVHVLDGVPQDGMVPKNVVVNGKRTSMRLEPAMWQALEEISRAEGCTVAEICDTVEKLCQPGHNFTSAMRVFIMEYYRKGNA